MSRRDKNSDNIEQKLHDTDYINKEGERDLLGLTEEDYRDIARGLKERELKYGFVPEGPETIEEVRFNYEDETEAKDPAKEGETDKQEPPKEEKKKKKGGFKNWLKTGRPWVKILILVLILLLITGGVLAATIIRSMEDAVEEMNKNAEIPEDYDLSLQPVDGFINILLLGVDTRDMDEIEGSRSDMIMIASINAKTDEVTLTSVYRDTYLKLGDTPTYDKITHGCYYGGPEMTMKSLNQAMDLNMEKYVLVNFKSVADVVDAVGGITVDVQEEEISELNKFTKETARAIGREKGTYKLVEAAGVQTLEGVQAVSYGRIRKGVGDDFKRTERMRTVVNLIFDKMKNMSFAQIKSVVNIVVPQCRTNLSFNDILALGKDITKYSIKSGIGFPYQVGTKTYNNVSYVFPTNLGQSVIQFHQEVFGQEEYVLSDMAAAISNEIYNRYVS